MKCNGTGHQIGKSSLTSLVSLLISRNPTSDTLGIYSAFMINEYTQFLYVL